MGEFKNKPFNWEVLSPRRAANPYYSFDNFGNSLSILFQIVSQEGWTDVMWSAMGAAGVGNQPKDKNSQGNAVFFIIFNLLGAVFVLTLFVSVFMRNYTEQTGVAFLTADQRSWLELRKLLRQISPSKRPSSKADKGFRGFCYRIAVKKHGRWQRLLTTVLFFHLVLLVLEWYPEPDLWKRLRGELIKRHQIKWSETDVSRLYLPYFHRLLHRQRRCTRGRTYLETIQEELLGSLFSSIHHWHSCHHITRSFKIQY